MGMDQVEVTLNGVFVVLSLLYFPLVNVLSNEIQVTLSLGVLVILNYVKEVKYVLSTFLFELVNAYHIYLLISSLGSYTEILYVIASLLQTLISIYYSHARIFELVYMQAAIMALFPAVTLYNEVRAALAMVVWIAEAYFGKESNKVYLGMILLPVARLDINFAKVFCGLVVGSRVFSTYEKYKISRHEPRDADVEEAIEERPEAPIPEIEEAVTLPSPPPSPVPEKKEILNLSTTQLRKQVERPLKFVDEPPKIIENVRKLNTKILHA